MLQQLPGKEGRWEDGAWNGTTPATFAFVVGVSDYPHLVGDDASYGLKSLPVSALTAFRIFRAMQRHDLDPRVPLRKAWLGLAPTAVETQAEPALVGTAFVPTFANLEVTVQEWHLAMKDLHPDVAKDSRAVFFFSGHGLEMTPDKQILLPSDYLAPPFRHVNRALSTANLYAGLRALAVPHQFYFVDACRNDCEALIEAKVDGREILPEFPGRKPILGYSAPIIYAVGSGDQAMSPAAPDKPPGCSYFGKALLDAIDAPPARLTCDAAECRLTISEFNSLVAEGVVRELGAAGIDAETSTVCSGGMLKLPDRVVAIRRPAAAGGPQLEAAVAPAAPAPPPVEKLAPGQEGPLADAYGPVWQAVRSERVTGFMTSLGFSSLARPNAPLRAALSSVRERSEGLFEFHVQLPSAEPAWWQGIDNKTVYGGALPADEPIGAPARAPRFRFVVQRGKAALRRVEVGLSDRNEDDLAGAAALWDRYRSMRFGGLEQKAARLLQDVVAHKRESPLAAIVAIEVLLRAGETDRLKDWPENLKQWFPQYADAAVLAREVRWQSGPDAPPDLESSIRRAGTGGSALPYTTEALSHLAQQLQAVSRDPHLKVLDALRDRVESAVLRSRGQGLFVTYAGPEGKIDRSLVLPL